MGIKWMVFEAIQNTRNSCFIRYKTLCCASRFISDKALMLVFQIVRSILHIKRRIYGMIMSYMHALVSELRIQHTLDVDFTTHSSL